MFIVTNYLPKGGTQLRVLGMSPSVTCKAYRTILLSVISLLNEPNIHSAAHVDASVAYRKWVESKGKEKAYENKVR